MRVFVVFGLLIVSHAGIASVRVLECDVLEAGTLGDDFDIRAGSSFWLEEHRRKNQSRFSFHFDDLTLLRAFPGKLHLGVRTFNFTGKESFGDGQGALSVTFKGRFVSSGNAELVIESKASSESFESRIKFHRCDSKSARL